MQCAKHRIAAGPDGRCALCRRETTADAASASRRLVWIAGIGLGLAVVALLLARPLGAVFSPPVAVAPEVPSAVAHAPESASELPEPEPEAEREARAEPNREAVQVEAADAAPPPAASMDAQPAMSASPTPDSSVAATPPTLAPSAPPARPTQEALASAVRATPITMFSTAWCGVCARARAFLDANGLRYSERDIDHDENAREELKRRTGKSSIPTFEIDGQLLTPGFSENAVMTAVAKSAQRRLGIEKLELRRTQ